jgi:hypothetical protein
VFFNDVCSIMEVLDHEFIPDQWHLFIETHSYKTRNNSNYTYQLLT